MSRVSEQRAINRYAATAVEASADRRRHGRFRVSGQTMVICRAGMTNGDILNISANGVCVSGAHTAEPGEEVRVVHVPVGDIEGRVVRVEPDSISIEFPISVRSVQFALDAVMHRLKSE